MEVCCATCGASRSAELATATPRPPCPECGGTGLSLQIGIASEVNTAATVNIALGTQPARDWRRRWEALQREIKRLHIPRTGELSGAAIHAAQQELQSFFIQAYHLKDALKADTAAHLVSGSTIEEAITTNPDLALLADLANLDKHFSLDQHPRSGEIPRVVSMRGLGPGSGEDGWHLEVQISHGNRLLDGLEVADAALAAWNGQLEAWGML